MRTRVTELDPDRVAAEGGDFDAMVRVWRPKVFRFALAWLNDSDAAETVTQDCFLKAFRSLDGFRRECSLETWLMQIAVNLLRDYRRNRRFQFWKRSCESSEPLEDARDRIAGTGKSPEAQALLDEKVRAVWQAAGNLPDRQRTIFLLRFVEDMDLIEIATATGLKEGTVKAHLFSAVRNVRRQMEAGA